jgi:hypothetical protein
MTAKYFIVADRNGNISHKPAGEVVTRNTEAYLRFDTPLHCDLVLAQADTVDQGQRFVELLSNQRVA